MRRNAIFFGLLATACVEASAPRLPPRLNAVGPRVISNASSYPLMIWGENLAEGTVAVIRTVPPVRLKTSRVDDRHLTARLPSDLPILPQISAATFGVVLTDVKGSTLAGESRITVINDRAFDQPLAIQLSGENGFIAVKNRDQLRSFDGKQQLDTCDRPRMLANSTLGLVVACEEGVLEVWSEPKKRITVPGDIVSLVIARTGLAYAGSNARDRIYAVDLATGELRSELRAGLNPTSLALGEKETLLIAGNAQSQDVSVIDLATKAETRLRPAPGLPIIGGHTEKYSAQIMGSTPPRAVVYSEKEHLAFVATLGPNIGPNSERMEVSQNGGISVIDARGKKWLRHVSMLSGVPEALALDDERGLLYAADGSTGRVVAFDTERLSKDDVSAREAILAILELPAPEGVPHIRLDADFGIEGRSRIGLHFGAKSLVLSSDGQKLYVLSRFSGEVLVLDTSKTKKKKLSIASTFPPFVRDKQIERRKGEVVFYTDLGNTRMTCDTCHPDGHTGGVMYSKGRPIRIYRAPTCRAIRESPPYFTPSRLPSIKKTVHDVLARNRFQNPVPTDDEISAATEMTGTFALLPNPFFGPDGTLPAALELPDGKTGNPRAGLALFEGKAGCAEERCHPPPHFTGDQTPATRGSLHKLGTPMALQLRPELQDLEKDFGQPPPSLAGVWDQFPLFLSGAGGNEVLPDGTVSATTAFALRAIFTVPAWRGKHGQTQTLSSQELDDLLAYLMTL
jgi:DNA-binding beta-propeller fold protein YncE